MKQAGRPYSAWLAVVLLLLAVVLPHHHHDGGWACYAIERCLTDGHWNDVHTQHGPDDASGRKECQWQMVQSGVRGPRVVPLPSLLPIGPALAAEVSRLAPPRYVQLPVRPLVAVAAPVSACPFGRHCPRRGPPRMVRQFAF